MQNNRQRPARDDSALRPENHGSGPEKALEGTEGSTNHCQAEEAKVRYEAPEEHGSGNQDEAARPGQGGEESGQEERVEGGFQAKGEKDLNEAEEYPCRDSESPCRTARHDR